MNVDAQSRRMPNEWQVAFHFKGVVIGPTTAIDSLADEAKALIRQLSRNGLISEVERDRALEQLKGLLVSVWERFT